MNLHFIIVHYAYILGIWITSSIIFDHSLLSSPIQY